MHVKILGSAAGGGFPQWNCGCRNCSSLRAGKFNGKARTQTQVAVSEDGRSWFLLGASPDLRAQIEATPELHPRDGVRRSPIAGVVLTNADIDHVLGLLLLRELQPFCVYATESVRRILQEDNSMFAMLNRVPDQVQWADIVPGKIFPLDTVRAVGSGLANIACVEAITPSCLKRGRSASSGTSTCSTRWRRPLVPFVSAAYSKAPSAI